MVEITAPLQERHLASAQLAARRAELRQLMRAEAEAAGMEMIDG
ncbi:hypothetical protein [Mangrovicoccus ximenensis]|nr:hypothetical protein [Mangrovicoccus ximenensis]